jgi:type IV secretion system protein VirB3
MTERADLENMLFLALTRPAMRWGVPVKFFMGNLVGSFVTGAWIGRLLQHNWYMFIWFVVWAALIHVLLREFSNRDHNLLNCWGLWLLMRGQQSLSNSWGGPSLAPLPTWQPRARLKGELPISIGRDA